MPNENLAALCNELAKISTITPLAEMGTAEAIKWAKPIYTQAMAEVEMKLFASDKPDKKFYIRESEEHLLDEIEFELLEAWQINPNDKVVNGIKLFHRAAHENNLEAVKLAVKAKIPRRIINHHGFTELTTAAHNGSIETVEYLVEELGLDPAECDLANGMPHNTLHAACAGNQFLMIHHLLTSYPDKLHKDMEEPSDRKSPLQTLISENHLAIAEKFIKMFNPDLHHADYRGRTPLSTAFSCFINAGFDTIKNDQTQLEKLENLCLQLLEADFPRENPFEKYSENAKPGYIVINTCETALTQPSGTKLTKRITQEDVIATLMVSTPKLAVKLLEIAQMKPAGELQSIFIRTYNQIVPKLTSATNAKLRELMPKC